MSSYFTDIMIDKVAIQLAIVRRYTIFQKLLATYTLYTLYTLNSSSDTVHHAFLDLLIDLERNNGIDGFHLEQLAGLPCH